MQIENEALEGVIDYKAEQIFKWSHGGLLYKAILKGSLALFRALCQGESKDFDEVTITEVL